MVHAISTLILLAGLGAGALAGELDLTPRESYYLAETTKVPCVAFRNGSAEVSYTPPHGWKLTGGGSKVNLAAPDVVQAGASIETAPMKDPLPATEANVNAYADLAPKYVSRDATKVTVVDSGMAPLGISRHTLVEVTLTYALFGQSYTTNILFMPFEQQLVTFQVTARTADFPPIAKAFRASLFSLQGLTEGTKDTAKAGTKK